MRRRTMRYGLWAILAALSGPAAVAQDSTRTVDLPFVSHDGHAMRGRLTLPTTPGLHPVVIYVQTAEGMTIEMKRSLGGDRTFSYFDLYATRLPALGAGFFRYDGRGIGMGDAPPRYETIDTTAFNTSTLDNKVRDLLAAVRLVQAQPGVDRNRIYLMGASEGTLLIADAATRIPGEVAGLVMYGVMAENLRETFRFIMGEGAFMPHRRFLDTDGDGRISRAEFDADPRGYRAQAMPGVAFEVLDPDRDSLFTVADMRLLTKVYLDAVDQENYPVLQAWARAAAAVAVPADWFRDHFGYPPMWSFLSRLDIPVGLFHGEADAMTSADGVRRLEAEAVRAGKRQMTFRYFPGLDHALGLTTYFLRGTLPPGHEALFEWLRVELGGGSQQGRPPALLR